MEVYNCPLVSVLNSVFEHNGPASLLKSEQFQGQSGGLSIGYFQMQITTITQPNISVCQCVFRNNSALPDSEELSRSSTQAFRQNKFPGRGGGVSIVLSEVLRHIEIFIDNCNFESNSAAELGGGMFTVLDRQSNHTITIRRTKFAKNKSNIFAGGLFNGYFDTGTPDFSSTLFVMESEFEENSALEGGAMLFALPGKRGKAVHVFSHRLPDWQAHMYILTCRDFVI